MTNNRTVSRAPLAILGLLTLAVGLASSAVSAPRVRLRVDVFPRQLPSTGGQIHIRVTTGGVPLDAVFATITRPDRTPLTEQLSPTDAVGQFETFVTLPENEGRAAQRYSIRVFARGEAERGHTAPGGTVRVKGATEVEPLIITSCSALPLQLPSGGGSFVVAARLTGLRRVSVQAHVVGPGVDLEQPMTLRAGAYKTNFVLPPNTSASPQVFQIGVIATPASGDPVIESCGSVTVRSPNAIPGIAIAGIERDRPSIKTFRADTLESTGSFFAFDPSFEGSANVAAGDVTGDGLPDLAVAAGPGAAPLVQLIRGGDVEPLGSFFAYSAGFTGGVNVAAGDVNGDGRADIITGAGAGSTGGHVKVFDGASGAELLSFLAFDPAFLGGVRVAAGDVNGDGRADIITAAGPGAGPHVKVFSGANLSVLRSFFAFGTSFTGGVNVAAGDVNGDGRAEVIVASGPGAAPHVKVFNGATGAELRSFLAFGSSFQGGVTVAAADLVGDGRADVITGAGPGAPGGHVKVFSGATGAELRSFLPFDSNFTGGVSVAGVPSVNPILQPQ